MILRLKAIFIIFLISFSYSYGQLVNDIKVNEDTSSCLKGWNAKISINQNGNVAIVWSSEDDCLITSNIYCQLYNFKLNKSGNNFRVNNIPDHGLTPDVAVSPNGNIGIVYQQDTYLRLFFRLFNKDGIALTSDVQINDSSNADYELPEIISDINNGFIVVYMLIKSNGNSDIYYQRFDSAGNKIGKNVNVSLLGTVYTSFILYGPQIAMQKDGGFIITWQDKRRNIYSDDIYMQMFDKNGLPIGENAIVNDTTSNPGDTLILKYDPFIAVDSSGGFTISYNYFTSYLMYYSTKYQRYNKNGVKLGNNKILNNGMFCLLTKMSSDEEGNLVFQLKNAGGIDASNIRVDKNDLTIGSLFAISNYPSSAKVSSDLIIYDNKIYNAWMDHRSGRWDIYANVRSFVNPDSTVGINQIGTEVPVEYSLSQNYPNPFNPVTKINFAIPKQGFVTIKLYDILGREVSRLVNEYKTAGEYTIDFNAGNLSSGIYFYRIEVNGFSDIKKMMFIK